MSIFKFFDESRDNSSFNKVSEDNAVVDFKLREGFNRRFQLETHSTLFALGNKAIDIRNESVWVIKEIKVIPNGYKLHVEVESHNVFNNNPSFDGVVKFSKLFNIPLQELILNLDLSGNVVQVINQQQVIEVWNAVKTEILPSLNAEEAQIIIHNGDSQFGNPIVVLRDTLIYNLFFEPVYGIRKKGEIKVLEKKTFTSQLFQNVTIPYNPLQKVTEINKNNLHLSYETEVLGFDKEVLVNVYNQIYKDVMEGGLDYKIGFTGNSIYDMETGLIKNCLIEVRESVNDNLRFECNYSIKEI